MASGTVIETRRLLCYALWRPSAGVKRCALESLVQATWGWSLERALRILAMRSSAQTPTRERSPACARASFPSTSQGSIDWSSTTWTRGGSRSPRTSAPRPGGRTRRAGRRRREGLGRRLASKPAHGHDQAYERADFRMFKKYMNNSTDFPSTCIGTSCITELPKGAAASFYSSQGDKGKSTFHGAVGALMLVSGRDSM